MQQRLLKDAREEPRHGLNEFSLRVSKALRTSGVPLSRVCDVAFDKSAFVKVAQQRIHLLGAKIPMDGMAAESGPCGIIMNSREAITEQTCDPCRFCAGQIFSSSVENIVER
jgi:hypothetical protein